MGFWFHKSIELGGDLALDFTGADRTLTLDAPAFSYAIPETCLFFRDDIYLNDRPPTPPPSPGYLRIVPEAPPPSTRWEQAFTNGIAALAAGRADAALEGFREAAEGVGRELPSIRLLLALTAIGRGQLSDAAELLQAVAASDDRLPDDLMRAHLSGSALEVHVTTNLTAHMSMDRRGAALLLGELLQRLGRVGEATELLETLGWRTQEPALALALADLYLEQDLHLEVARVTGRFTANANDLSLQILLLRARARRERGDHVFSLVTLEEALRFPERDPHLLRVARYERALTLAARGHDAPARQELELILDEDRGFRDVAERLSAGGREGTEPAS